jgi:hypothetical protein
MNQNLDDGRSGVKISQEGSLLTASPVSPQSLRIDPEFKNLIPPLLTDERRQLMPNYCCTQTTKRFNVQRGKGRLWRA